MKHLNHSSEPMPLMKRLRVDLVDVNNKKLSLLVCQETNRIYYSRLGYFKLKELYSEFKYNAESMLKINMYIPTALHTNVSMVEGVDYYF